jgi:hypothetical protein
MLVTYKEYSHIYVGRYPAARNQQPEFCIITRNSSSQHGITKPLSAQIAMLLTNTYCFFDFYQNHDFGRNRKELVLFDEGLISGVDEEYIEYYRVIHV